MKNAKQDEVARLRAWLDRIANPISYFRDQAKMEGKQLDGIMTVQLAENPNTLQQWARDALSGKQP